MHIAIRPIPSRLLSSSLEPGGAEKLEKISTPFEFPPDQIIFRMNDEPAAVWMVTHGRVCISTGGHVGRCSEVCGRRIFGLTETIAGIPYQETVKTDSFCSCRRIDRDALMNLLRCENEACSVLLRGLARNYLRGVRKSAS
ncbi:MAG: cyclic nucleotide-binding domain-containing protein [Acidobacteriota bacterium]